MTNEQKLAEILQLLVTEEYVRTPTESKAKAAVLEKALEILNNIKKGK